MTFTADGGLDQWALAWCPRLFWSTWLPSVVTEWACLLLPKETFFNTKRDFCQ